MRIVESARVPTALAPGQATDLKLAFLGAVEASGAQPMLGLVEATFDGSPAWAVSVDTTALDAEGALYLEKPAVARALVGKKSKDPAVRFCWDHRGQPYSQGALVPVVGEPAAFARCDQGAWVAQEIPVAGGR